MVHDHRGVRKRKALYVGDPRSVRLLVRLARRLLLTSPPYSSRSAIRMAEEGVPVSELHAHAWGRSENLIKNASPSAGSMLLNGRAPKAGEIMRFPNLAATFKAVAKDGRDGFYKGRIAKAIVELIKVRLSDFVRDATKLILQSVLFSRWRGLAEQGRSHGAQRSRGAHLEHRHPHLVHLQERRDRLRGESLFPTLPFSRSTLLLTPPPLALSVRTQCPPNGQGLTALLALGILDEMEKEGKIPALLEMEHNSVEYLHTLIEALRLSFADTR
jgi:gamma-glutamyltranspeptidase/glutathione hydrolase